MLVNLQRLDAHGKPRPWLFVGNRITRCLACCMVMSLAAAAQESHDFNRGRCQKIALVEGTTEDSIAAFQNDDKEILSGTRTMGEGLTLTVAAEAEEGQETEQEAVIEKLLADAVATDTAPATTVFGETVKDDVVIEADDGYLQLQLNDETALVSTFNFNYDKNVFSKALNLPGGLTVRYGNVQDKETGYIPFVSTVNNRNIKILATSVEALQGFFQG